MATTIKFTKMQGTGNDYIYVNTLSSPLQDPIKAARKWYIQCRRLRSHDVWKRLALHRQICIRERTDG